ncbi:LAME_0D00254g1_1 [Lachancea meyersii CBS 8951]|uniref:LAME_0D00254g1_1 n=1 Tax=Lachancea meyersii CBS 8951 TaxID=1266667 RepID=A0A1G4J5M9_9SACH|nr:LAME_0D00254g1_1 [Lachancea meyersii CBS 8951]
MVSRQGMKTATNPYSRPSQTSAARRRRPRKNNPKAGTPEGGNNNDKTSEPKQRKGHRRTPNAKGTTTKPERTSNKEKFTDIKRKGNAFSKNAKAARVSNESKDEIRQVQHVLGEESFKIFKKGKNSTSYGLIVPEFFAQESFTLVITIPFTYPKQPIKLDPNDNHVKDAEHSAQLTNILNNFNSKAHEMSLKSQPLLSQFNFLLTQWPQLGNLNYKQKDRLYKEFLASCT